MARKSEFNTKKGSTGETKTHMNKKRVAKWQM
jgi:hypothetical protein